MTAVWVVAFLALAGAAQADTHTWIGATSASWNVATNWSSPGGGVPTNGDSLLFAGAPARLSSTDNLAALTSVATVTFDTSNWTVANAGGSLTLTGGMSVASPATVSWAVPVTLGAAAVTVTNNGTLTFTTTATINSGGNLLTVTGSTTQTTLNGVISGAGGLAKSGTGTLALLAANTYTGYSTINAGKVQVSARNGLGARPGTYAAAWLTLNGGTLEALATFTLSANRGITLGAGGGTIDVDPTFTTTVSSIVSGPGSLTKADAGTLTLSGNNTYAGSTTVSGGVLRINSEARLGTTPGSYVPGQLTLNGGTLETLASFAISPNRGVTLGAGGGTIDVNPGYTTTVNSIVSGPGGLSKTDTGTLILGGTNSCAGTTTVNAGIVRTSKSNALPTGTTVSLADVAARGTRPRQASRRRDHRRAVRRRHDRRQRHPGRRLTEVAVRLRGLHLRRRHLGPGLLREGKRGLGRRRRARSPA